MIELARAYQKLDTNKKLKEIRKELAQLEKAADLLEKGSDTMNQATLIKTADEAANLSLKVFDKLDNLQEDFDSFIEENSNGSY